MKARIIGTDEIIDVINYENHYRLNYASTDNIDWEQRRYEIAKAVLHEYTMPEEERYISNEEYAARVAVAYADALIEELKKK